MNRKRHMPSEISAKLEQAAAMTGDANPSIRDICQALDISRATYYRWRAQYGEMTPAHAEDHARLMTELRRVEKCAADYAAQIDVLRAVLEGNSSALPASATPLRPRPAGSRSASGWRAGRSASLAPPSATVGG